MLNRYFDAKDNIDFIYANIAVKNIYFALISLEYIFYHPVSEIGIYHDEHTFYFFHIQSILNACGNISNVFYNNNKQSTQRCRRLREQLNIYKQDFPLVFQKEVRNTNAHFDERYEAFDGCIGDYNLIDNDTDPEMREIIETNPHLRTYYKETGIYHTIIRKNKALHNFEYNLHTLENQLRQMYNRITENPIFNAAWVDTMPTEQVE